MGERGAVDEVADRVDAGARGAHRAVDLAPAALVELDARLGQAEALDVGAAAGGDHEVVDLRALLAVGERHAAARSACTSPIGAAGVDVDALALEAALDQARDVRVLGRQHAVERLEQDHLAAEPREARGDLGARGARADHRQARGQLLQRPRLLGADHAPAELDAGDRPRDRARSRGSRCRRRRPARAVGARTRTSPSAVSAASPSITSMPFFLNSPETPEVSVSTTFSRRAWIAA